MLCYPAPVAITRLIELKDIGSNGTTVNHFAAWYGVLEAYTRYTAGLLEKGDAMPAPAEIKVTKVFEILQSMLRLFADIVSIIIS